MLSIDNSVASDSLKLKMGSKINSTKFALKHHFLFNNALSAFRI